MEGFRIRGWGLFPPGAAELHKPHPIRDHPVGLGLLHRARRCRPVGSPFSSSVCWICTCLEEFMIRGWGHIIPGWRWLYQLRPISNQPVGLGFPHRAGRCQPGGPPFSSPVRRSCRCVEGFMIRGCGLILPGCGGSPRTPVNQRSTSGVGVVTPCAAVSIREISFSFPVCWEL